MKALLSIVAFLAVTSTFQSPVHAQSDNGITIHQEVYIGATPEQLYQTLLSSEQFSASTKKSFDMFTAASAKIDAREGGTFSLFDGHIIGRILELVPGKRIVEAWRVVDWPQGVYSIARFDLKPKGTGTQLVFDHIGFPAGLKEHLATGWQEHYWAALNTYFQGH
jgi:activator of HSP90 ATPase